jgi:SAM-dependent methyltransferase
MITEIQRILKVYQDLDARLQSADRFFGFENLAAVNRVYDRYRETLRLLKKAGYHPLTGLSILDVGCGDGHMLRQFVQWGALPGHLAGIELRPEPVKQALELTPTLDIRCGSATELPWSEASFDLVCQHTVFTSVLDQTMRQQIAAEMKRVLRPGGAILWYDFMYNNPKNQHVRGVKAGEIGSLFSGLEIHLHRITLAPPIARRIPESLLPLLYPLLATLPILRTHYLGLFIKRDKPDHRSS